MAVGTGGGVSLRPSGEVTSPLIVDDLQLQGHTITALSGEDLNLVTSGQVLINGVPISGSANSADVVFNNNSGSPISAWVPVRVDGDSINTVDVSVEAEVRAIIGITQEAIADGGSGVVVTDGRLEDVTTSIAVNSIVYLSSTGGITDTPPDIGVDGFVAGDFVVKVGVIAENPDNAAQKDLIVDIDIFGQL